MTEEWLKRVLKEYDKKQKRMLNSKWTLGFKDRGMGHGDFGVIISKKDNITLECPSKEVAEHLVKLHNDSLPKRKKRNVD